MIRAGVMGDPIGHSLSPKLHGHWLSRYAIQGSYDALHVLPNALADALSALQKEDYAGVNLTLPHKEKALTLMHTLSPEAKAIGAVNTVMVLEDGTLHGHNTDAYGFIENIKQTVQNLAPHLEHCVVLGAGGAARAVIYGLLQSGAKKISIANRTPEKAQAMAVDFGERCEAVAWENCEALLAQASMLINSTSLGMSGKAPLKISLDALPISALVSDIVYTPLQTDLLKMAASRGNITVEGLGMLLHQAAPGFEAWFGVKPEVDAALEEAVKEAL